MGKFLALESLCRKGDLEGLMALISREGAQNIKAVVNETSEQGCSPLFFACAHGHAAVVKLLIRLGADLRATTSLGGHTCLVAACESSAVAVVPLLLERGKFLVHIATLAGETPLYVASRAGHALHVPLLVAEGADLNAADA